MRKLGMIAVSALAFAGAASAQNLFSAGGMTIEEVGAILEREGLDVSYDDGGEAGRIASEFVGARFEVMSVHCNNAKRCTEFLFIAGFDLEDGFPLTKINEWNAERIGGRAFLDDENDPFLDHVVSVSGPGDVAAFREGLFLWQAAIDDFADFIDLPDA